MMEDIYTLQRTEVINDRNTSTNFNGTDLFPERTKASPVIDSLIAEGGENFFHYISWLGLANEADLLVLSSKYHYYYDLNDLKGVKTVINLKKLNLIKHLDSFIHTVNNIISPKTNFIGCFYDKNNRKRVGFPTRFYKKLLNYIDSKVFIEVDKKDVLILLESHGFKVIDMTEINGITYFRTQNTDNKKMN